MPRVKAWEGYSLSATLAPSFVRALFEERGGFYVKIAGHRRGARMWQEGEEVVGEGCDEEELRYWSGIWLDRSLVEEKATHLAAAHKELGLSVSPYDRHLIFVAVFLSRATSWEGNVLRWCRGIFSRADTLEALLKLDFVEFGSSFQLKQLGPALRRYAEQVHCVSDPWEVRRALLSLRNVGPKLADAYLLFTGLDPSAPPIDRHALRMTARLGLSGVSPRRELCARYPCPECPTAASCIRWALSSIYGSAAGWVQTAFYVHDTLFCSLSSCQLCPLSRVCEPGSIKGARPRAAR
jgi:endonuclease III